MIAYGVDSKQKCTDEHRDNAKDVTGSGSRERKRRKMKQKLYSHGNVVNVLCGEVPLLLNNKWPNSAHAQSSIILHIYVVFVIMVLPSQRGSQWIKLGLQCGRSVRHQQQGFALREGGQ